jgi:ribosomal protein L6P/L9E
MTIKLKYSNLLQLSIFNKNYLVIKGPLGIKLLKVNPGIQIRLNLEKKVIFFTILSKKKKFLLNNLITLFSNLSRSVIFGNIIMLELEGLGFKFIDLVFTKSKMEKRLSMNLGYSNLIYYLFKQRLCQPFFKSTRSLLLYSSDYAFLTNTAASIFLKKVPDKYKKKGFKIQKFD